MLKSLPVAVLTVVLLAVVAALPARADEYAVDPVHSGLTFKISHIGLSQVPGRFNDFSGAFVIDPDPAKCSFSGTIKVESVDTGNAQRDTHLRSPDFFNAKQYPTITFKSTSVKAVKDGYEVTGEFTMHGATKPVVMTLTGGHKAEFPKGVQRTGFWTTGDLVIKRSDFGMDKALDALGDEVHIAITFEGTKK
jgi:polyisoprenoid-binding protein YceI